MLPDDSIGTGGAGGGTGDGTGSGGTGAATGAGGKWYDSFSDETLKGNDVIRGFDGPESLAKDFIKLHGSRLVVPDKPDAYALTLPEGADAKRFEQRLASFREDAHKAGLSNDQAQKLFAATMERRLQRDAQITERIGADKETATKELQKTWGADKFDERISRIDAFVNKHGSKEFNDFLVRSGMGNNVHLITFLDAVMGMISPDRLIDEGAGGGKTEKSRAEIIFDGK